MKIEFENQYYETKKTLAHFYGKSVYKYYRWIGIVLLFFGGIQVIAVMADTMDFFAEPLSSEARLFFFDLGTILMVLGILLLCQHLITARIALRQMKKTGRRVAPQVVCRFGEDIHLAVGASNSVYSYSKIYGIIETREEYALMAGRHAAIRARKGCFSLGKEGDFPEFLRKRCPEAKWKRR